MSSDYMTGAELQCLREACGLDRDQLGALCGVQGRSIKYWEMGASNHGVPADVAAMVIDIEDSVNKATALLIQHYAGRSDVAVLMRTGDAVSNEVASRVFLELRKRGQDVRIVAFDIKDFRQWLDETRGRDTPATRQQWANLAVAAQAKPHRTDQPI